MANKDTQRTSAESYRDDRKARLAQSAKKSQKKSEKSKAAAKIVKMVVAIVLAVVVAGGIVWKVLDDTAAIKKNTTVFSLGDDIRVSEVEFTYYYSQYLNNIYSYAQQYARYGMNIGIDPTKSPDEQNYGTDADGKEMLLSDYLKNETISALQTYKILYAEAIKAGYKLTDDEQKSIDDQVEELRNTAAENKYSLNAYLKASYGKGINEKFLRKQLEMQNIVSRYQSDTAKKLTDSYSAADIKAVYDKDHSAYNAVDARTLSFAIETLTAKDGETSEQLAAGVSRSNFEKLFAHDIDLNISGVSKVDITSLEAKKLSLSRQRKRTAPPKTMTRSPQPPSTRPQSQPSPPMSPRTPQSGRLTARERQEMSSSLKSAATAT